MFHMKKLMSKLHTQVVSPRIFKKRLVAGKQQQNKMVKESHLCVENILNSIILSKVAMTL